MDAWDIELRTLRAGYGDLVVLRDVDALLPGGGISVILGESGCGKSTLLRHITGLKRPLSGSVLIGGRDIFALAGKDFRKARRQMGVLFQDGALLGALTLEQNVGLPLSEHLRLPKATIRAEALRVLAMVGLESFADFYPNQLSGGMRKRAGLARALITAPKVLLCDEPTSGLDPITASRMDALLLSMHGHFAGMTMVVVSHDLESLKAIASHVLVIREGRAVFSGTPAALEASPDPYLRQFLHRKASSDVLEGREPDPGVSEAIRRWRDA
jgi:phospholipid/cholesterol/gamma-HCH transport system ATP-binding protein